MERANREIVRALGAVEQTIDVYIYRTPVQFSQDRHPELGVAVDRAGLEAVVRMSNSSIPIEVADDGTSWEYIVATADRARPGHRPRWARTGSGWRHRTHPL